MKLIQAKRWSIRTVLAILLIASWAGAEAKATDCYILSAGVDNYADGGKLNGDLNDARNTSRAFAAQKGKLFNNVYARVLLDKQATNANFMKQVNDFSKLGKPGDFFVIFFSGHGGRFSDSHKWFLVPYDSKAVSGEALLKATDVLVKQNKRVVIVIDACFSGQLNVEAQPYLKKYRNANGGGLIVMCSSGPDQLSNALGNYSAFAKAFADAMAGGGDLNHDGKITLLEIRSYTRNRTAQLLKQANNSGKQDTVVSWSPSFAGDSPLAATRPMMAAYRPIPAARPVTSGAVASKAVAVRANPAQPTTVWKGNESLPGFGRLTFETHTGGRAVMTDARETSEGTWQQNGKQMTLRFSNGRVVYTGTINGQHLVGTADNQNTSWSFSVQRQDDTQTASNR